MASLARDAILTATLLALIFMFAHQPSKPQIVQVDYCVIDYHVGAFDQNHELHTGWGKGYGPCSLLDRYEQI